MPKHRYTILADMVEISYILSITTKKAALGFQTQPPLFTVLLNFLREIKYRDDFPGGTEARYSWQGALYPYSEYSSLNFSFSTQNREHPS